MKKLTLLAAALFLGCAEIPEELRAEANGDPYYGQCSDLNYYYGSPNCPGYYDCPSGSGCVPSSSDPCSGSAYYSNPNCGGYYSCPSGYGCYHYSYCVYHSWQQCDQGSYDSSNCGGEPMDYCPYSRPSVSYGYVSDGRDGRTYKTVWIGGQNWMAENLDYDVAGSKCYDCSTYGRLYDWAAAMGIDSSYNYYYYSPYAKHQGVCRYGWHIPSDGEWETLFSYVGGSPYLDRYGFAALPGGYGTWDGSFYDAGSYGYWWSASEDDSKYAYYRYSYGWGINSKTGMYSVRCLQD